MSFAGELRAFAVKAVERAHVVHQVTTLEMASRIIARMPVLTGRARGNVTVSSGQADLKNDYPEDKDGSSTISRVASVIRGIPLGTDMIISNNLIYIVPLEHGHSMKAPADMFAVTVAEFAGIVDASLQIALREKP
jgi:hypothetical protein